MKLGLRTSPRERVRTRGGPGAQGAPRASAPLDPDQRYDFSPGSSIKIQQHLVGRERNPVLVVDGLLANPRSAVAFAAAEVRYIPGPEMTYYPGIRGRGSDAYAATLLGKLSDLMRQTFGLRENVRLTVDTMFSLTTTPPAELRPLQKVPHVDNVGPRGLAGVHFLFDAPLGGTGFFRHKATGWETLSDDRAERYDRMVAQELEQSGAPGGYIFDETPYFEPTFRVEPAMDRLVLFSGHVLHSATVPPGVELPTDPLVGRLTMNSFITLS